MLNATLNYLQKKKFYAFLVGTAKGSG